VKPTRPCLLPWTARAALRRHALSYFQNHYSCKQTDRITSFSLNFIVLNTTFHQHLQPKPSFSSTIMSASNNPGNFANRPTEEVKAIASMGGKASHGTHGSEESHPPGRNADGTFVKGSEAAKEAGHIGGLHAHHKTEEQVSCQETKGYKVETDVTPQADHPAGRNPDGTFTKGSEAAKEAGHIGGLHAHHHDDSNVRFSL
jgi:general stress protein YciG